MWRLLSRQEASNVGPFWRRDEAMCTDKAGAPPCRACVWLCVPVGGWLVGWESAGLQALRRVAVRLFLGLFLLCR